MNVAPAQILSFEEYIPIRVALRDKGQSLVLMKGVFDLLHAGHIRALLAGSLLGDYLVVAVTSDGLTQAKKGATRPIIPGTDRMFQISSLRMVDYVVENVIGPLEGLLRAIDPDVFTASHFSDLDRSLFPHIQFVETPKVGHYDTSAIIKKIKGST